MVIAASLFVLAVAAVTHRAHILTENTVVMSADLPDQTSHSSSGQALLKARIGFARRIGNLADEGRPQAFR
jgi:hypothetical protein